MAVTSTVRPARLVSVAPTDPAQSDAISRFLNRAVNDESLAAEYALFVARDTLNTPQPALAVLWAAVSMRVYGQERIWFPGYGGPSVPDLKDRYGLASISFDAEVPTVWRPYYLRMLGSVVSDLQRVLPAFTTRVLWSPRTMFAGLLLLTVGCLVRVVSEVVAYQRDAAWAWAVSFTSRAAAASRVRRSAASISISRNRWGVAVRTSVSR